MLLSVLEGVAFAIRDNMEIIRALGIPLSRATLSGGGARSPLWCRILASVLSAELSLLETEEGPALGATRLAAVASGKVGSLSEISAPLVRERFLPEPVLVARYEKKYEKFKKIYPSMKGLFRELKGE
jgi:xylulokinase